jgi:hypothetical protein
MDYPMYTEEYFQFNTTLHKSMDMRFQFSNKLEVPILSQCNKNHTYTIDNIKKLGYRFDWKISNI